MQNEVYITNASTFLPNSPIANEEMEEYLGLIHKHPSKSKRIVLRNNGIKQRHYAIDKKGNATHTNAQMASLAIRNLFKNDAAALNSIDLLCCGTSSPDQIMPAHGVMVHGWLPDEAVLCGCEVRGWGPSRPRRPGRRLGPLCRPGCGSRRRWFSPPSGRRR